MDILKGIKGHVTDLDFMPLSHTHTHTHTYNVTIVIQ